MTKVLLISMILVLGFGANALAVSLTFNYDGVFSGSSPGGTAPWLTAKFEQVDADTVRLTMSTAGLIGSEFVDGKKAGWYFNFDDAEDVEALRFTFVSGYEADVLDVQENDFKADGDGYYDIAFAWKDPNFIAGQTAVYLIDYALGLSIDDFNFKSSPGGGEGVYESAARVQGIAGGLSGWVYPSGGGVPGNGEVPEPGTIVLLGLGLFGLGLLGKRNFTK